MSMQRQNKALTIVAVQAKNNNLKFTSVKDVKLNSVRKGSFEKKTSEKRLKVAI